MRVLFVLSSFPEVSESFIINQIVSLIDESVDVDILSYDIGKDIPSQNELVNRYDLINKTFYIEKENSLIIRLMNFFAFSVKNCKTLINKKFLKNIRLFYNYQKLLINHYDIVHCHFGNVGARFSDDFFNRDFFKNSKLICTFHGFDANPSKVEEYKLTYKKMFNHFDAFTVNTPYLLDIIYKINSSVKVFELPVGFNLDFLTNYLDKGLVVKDSIFRILFCGRLVYWKGIFNLVKIALELKKVISSGWVIHIIGDGPEYENLKKEIKDKNLDDSLLIEGSRNQTEVFDMMNRSDLFISPGIYDKSGRAETQGLVIQEAQFFFLPVIVSDAGGAKYGLIPGKTGAIVDHQNINSYVDQIVSFFQNRDLAKEFGCEGHRFVLDNYKSSTLVKKLIFIYNELISNNK